MGILNSVTMAIPRSIYVRGVALLSQLVTVVLLALAAYFYYGAYAQFESGKDQFAGDRRTDRIAVTMPDMAGGASASTLQTKPAWNNALDQVGAQSAAENVKEAVKVGTPDPDQRLVSALATVINQKPIDQTVRQAAAEAGRRKHQTTSRPDPVLVEALTAVLGKSATDKEEGALNVQIASPEAAESKGIQGQSAQLASTDDIGDKGGDSKTNTAPSMAMAPQLHFPRTRAIYVRPAHSRYMSYRRPYRSKRQMRRYQTRLLRARYR